MCGMPWQSAATAATRGGVSAKRYTKLALARHQ